MNIKFFMLPKMCVYLNCYHICQKTLNTFKYQTLPAKMLVGFILAGPLEYPWSSHQCHQITEVVTSVVTSLPPWSVCRFWHHRP